MCACVANIIEAAYNQLDFYTSDQITLTDIIFYVFVARIRYVCAICYCPFRLRFISSSFHIFFFFHYSLLSLSIVKWNMESVCELEKKKKIEKIQFHLLKWRNLNNTYWSFEFKIINIFFFYSDSISMKIHRIMVWFIIELFLKDKILKKCSFFISRQALLNFI